MKRKRKSSFFSGLLVFLLLIVVACTITVNLVFSGERVPRIAGYYLYMQDSDDMEPTVPKASLVAAEAATISELHEGNTVLCYLADGTIAIRKVYKIEEAEEGTVNYYPGTAKEQGVDSAIPRTNIFAVCVWASPELYWYINFARTVNGLMALLVAPCVILIIMLLVHIASGNVEDMEDEEFDFEDEEEIPKPKQKKKKTSESPLYNPDKPATAPETLEEKKSSISENFTAKPVNENSPYQKAVQEREKTMKLKRQEIEAEALKVFEEPYPKQPKEGTQVYSAEQIREQARIQAQTQAKQTMPAAATVPNVLQPAPVISPNPEPVLSPKPAVQPAPVPKPEPPKPAPKPTYSSPNIDDILNASKKSSSSRSSNDSIDDLIRMLEDEKKKL